jgi:regulatory protein
VSECDPGPDPERLALKLLAVREHSRLELSRKLAARGFAEPEIAFALDRLTEQGALDESRLAEHYVRERADKGFGPLRIRRELKDKGLSDSAIAPHLASVADDWPARLALAHERRFGAALPSDPSSERAELARRARFLEQRGFAPETIRRFLRWND